MKEQKKIGFLLIEDQQQVWHDYGWNIGRIQLN